MSASREKKTRQDLAAQGITDPKKIREAEEKAKARKSNILYGVIAGVFVLVAAALLVWNSGVLQRNAAALSIDGEKYSASQVNYFYYSIKNNILNGGYASMYGVSSSTPLDQQVMNDTAKMFLGVEDEGEITWEQFIHDYAIKQMTLMVKEVKEAEANGHGADEHTEEEVASTIEQYTTYAKQNGYSLKEYLKLAFGKTMTVSTFKDMIRLVDIASHYESEYSEELSYTVSDLENYYNDNKASFDVGSYEYIYFKGTADSTTDAEGNTVEPSDEENAAAKELAAANANAALERYNNGESLEDIAKDYDNGTYSSTDSASNSGDTVTTWVFDSSRQAGDSAVLEVDANRYLVVFRSAGRQEYASRDVRHILFMADTSALDSESETYEADLQAAKDAAKAKAEDALAQWKSGDATEDSFAAMANELSEDGGSNTNGGLYTKVLKGDMVTEFNDWLFDESRKPGDTGIVFNDGSYTGYHVMYFVGDDVPCWQVQVEKQLRSSDTDTWQTGLTDSAEVVELSGMKHVG